MKRCTVAQIIPRDIMMCMNAFSLGIMNRPTASVQMSVVIVKITKHDIQYTILSRKEV